MKKGTGNVSARRVLIVGGGIGGVTLAYGLARSGVSVRIVEREGTGERLGTGICLLGNTLRALDHLGLADTCIANGFGYDTITTHDAAGNKLAEANPRRTFRPDSPAAIGIMRIRLAEILEAHALAEGVRIDYGTTIDEITQTDDSVLVRLSTGETSSYDLLVAADGAYSSTRKDVFGPEFKPVYAGQGGWRYTVPRPETMSGMEFYRAGHGRIVGGLPLSDKLCYYFLLENTAEHVRMAQEHLADLLLERLKPFSAQVLRAAAQHIQEPGAISFRPFDILLMPQPWFRGRVVLLGDAAHAMTPQLTSGGGMAIEDAVVLTEHLVGTADIGDALLAYSERRYKRVSQVYENSLRISRLEQDPDSDGEAAMAVLMQSHRLLAEPC